MIDKKNKIYKDLPFKFNLIYRAIQDGFSIRNFHNNCDNKGPTVVVIKIRNSKEIVGGYNPLKWRDVDRIENETSSLLPRHNHNDKCETSNSFIFLLKVQADPILSRVTYEKKAIIWSEWK